MSLFAASTEGKPTTTGDEGGDDDAPHVSIIHLHIVSVNVLLVSV